MMNPLYSRQLPIPSRTIAPTSIAPSINGDNTEMRADGSIVANSSVTNVTTHLTSPPLVRDVIPSFFVTNRATGRQSITLGWHERIANLPPKRRELLRPVLEDPRSFLFLVSAHWRESCVRIQLDAPGNSRDGFCGLSGFSPVCARVNDRSRHLSGLDVVEWR